MSVEPKKLLEILEDGIAAPVMAALREAVMAKIRNAAIRIIKKEAPFKPTECKVLYDYLANMLQGKDVLFVEVPKDEWAALAGSIPDDDDENDLREAPSFLVRYRCEIFRVQPMRFGDTTSVHRQHDEFVDWLELDQIWRIENK